MLARIRMVRIMKISKDHEIKTIQEENWKESHKKAMQNLSLLLSLQVG